MGGVRERTEFAALLAQTIREVADELQGIIERQQEAKEAIRERGRKNQRRILQRQRNSRGCWKISSGRFLTVQEEIEIAGSEGANITNPKGRIDHAENLYKEAQASFDKKNLQR